MNNPIELLQQAFSLTFKKPSLILGIIYFGIAMVIGFGVATIAVVAGLLGVGFLAAISNVWVTLTAILIAALIGVVVLFILEAALNIFAYKGFHQIILTGNYNFDEITETIKRRLVPAIVMSLIVGLLFLLLFAIPAIPLYLLFNEIGVIIALFVYFVLILIVGPFFLNATPIVALENVGGIAAISKSFSFGRKNYLFNLASMAIMLLLMIPLILLSLIPLLGLVVSYLFTIFTTFYTLKIYEENIKRTPGI